MAILHHLFVPPRIKLIAFDLDGTLLNRNREISDRNAAALRRAEEEGLAVVLASGRAIATILPFADQIGLCGPVVSCNGAYVVDAKRKEVFHQGLPETARRTIFDFVASTGVHLNLYLRSEVHFTSLGAFGQEYVRRTRFLEPTVSALEIMRQMEATKMLFMDTEEIISGHTEEMRGRLDPSEAVIAISEADYVEFLPPGVTKGRGLEELARSMGIDRSEIAAVGDYWNDLEMVEWAGFGGAMGNAVSGVKDAAKVVVADHDEDGAAEFVEIVLSENRR